VGAQFAVRRAKICNRAPAVREVEVRAKESNTAQVRKRTDLMSANSPKRADCRSRMRSTPPSRERCLDPRDSCVGTQ